MEKLTRVYTAKDVEMLTVGRTMTESAIAHIAEITAIKTNWVDPYLPNLKGRIDNAFPNYLGIDPKKDQRIATSAVHAIFTPAENDLAMLKTAITVDFETDKPRRDELLTLLGFTANLKKVQKGDQEALVNLLYKFKTNMTAAIKTEIVNKGTSGTLINTIKTYADTLKNANITQESCKSNSPEITNAGIKEFNEIYKQVIGLAKIGSKVFKENPAVKKQFSFSKLVKQLNSSQSDSQEPPTTTP